ncbi:hypothetical protein SISSUDRAFT_1029116 [Sistotremastrum suecicum HHB10207 ss-3]|uniref:RGS domain-containing protein n=1 Tax=Sistotremastrum suecicum HHB10207 ss-3 TaxID=1314776 RepID=A0A166J6K7_9AGAM|nr:hypothetical protein SISSUDRAFT_1029116 [Sistotremastrum suecicum HHB10207 ss-3]
MSSPMDYRPPQSTLSLRAILDFPRRLCNPPTPTTTKIRSCAVTPVFDVTLDDVLNRKHLPPLGLKDFEEWLLFVDRTPQNLYFVLWLKEYTVRYEQWMRDSRRMSRHRVGGFSFQSELRPVSQSLAMFCTRAKKTFFSPDSPYHLHVPAEHLNAILSPPPDAAADSPHPDPAVFAEINADVRTLMKASLSRFVSAAFENVSTFRGVCGVIGGCAMFLIAGCLPLILSILGVHSRWARLCSIPGLWFGLTIIVASLHGLCFMVYVFGDYRQLRSFELTRPAISGPAPVALSPVLPPAYFSRSSREQYEDSFVSTNASQPSLASHSSDSVGEGIFVSGAYPPDEMEEVDPDVIVDDPPIPRETAGFIHHYEGQMIVRNSLDVETVAGTQRLDHFDFDALPTPPKCLLFDRPEKPKLQPLEIPNPPSNPQAAPISQPIKIDEKREVDASHAPPPAYHYPNVPPFGPLTPVLSPVVSRAQWELLMRSTVVAFFLTCGIIAGGLAVPEVVRL